MDGTRSEGPCEKLRRSCPVLSWASRSRLPISLRSFLGEAMAGLRLRDTMGNTQAMGFTGCNVGHIAYPLRDKKGPKELIERRF